MCLDLASGPAHALARRTNLLPANQIATLEHRPNQQVTGIYELVPCPNSFETTETLTQREEYLKENVFYTSQDDHEISLACEDRKFLEIMESSVHKNESGNLEMPLPFRQKNVKMPNQPRPGRKPPVRSSPHPEEKAPNGKGLLHIHGEDPMQRSRIPSPTGRNETEGKAWRTVVSPTLRGISPEETYANPSRI